VGKSHRPKPSQQAEASLAQVPGQPGLRSVDSEHVSRVIEPRKCVIVVADDVEQSEGNISTSVMARMCWPTGVGEQGAQARALQGPGRSCRFHARLAKGGGLTASRLIDVSALTPMRANNRAQRWYRLARETEARRDERQEVRTPQ
jgi:hypothetical protein